MYKIRPTTNINHNWYIVFYHARLRYTEICYNFSATFFIGSLKNLSCSRYQTVYLDVQVYLRQKCIPCEANALMTTTEVLTHIFLRARTFT